MRLNTPIYKQRHRQKRTTPTCQERDKHGVRDKVGGKNAGALNKGSFLAMEVHWDAKLVKPE